MLRFDELIEGFISVASYVVGMIIKEVRDRGDGVKTVTIPKSSDIEPGDYVKIEQVEQE